MFKEVKASELAARFQVSYLFSYLLSFIASDQQGEGAFIPISSCQMIVKKFAS